MKQGEEDFADFVIVHPNYQLDGFDVIYSSQYVSYAISVVSLVPSEVILR